MDNFLENHEKFKRNKAINLFLYSINIFQGIKLFKGSKFISFCTYLAKAVKQPDFTVLNHSLKLN